MKQPVLGLGAYGPKKGANLEYNGNLKLVLALEVTHSDGKVIPTWSFLCHGFLGLLNNICVHGISFGKINMTQNTQ